MKTHPGLVWMLTVFNQLTVLLTSLDLTISAPVESIAVSEK